MLDLCKMSQYLTKIIQVDMCYLDKIRGANATLGNLWKSLGTFSTVHRLWACLWHHLEFIRFLYNHDIISGNVDAKITHLTTGKVHGQFLAGTCTAYFDIQKL